MTTLKPNSKEKPMAKSKTKDAFKIVTFLSSLKAGDAFRFDTGAPRNTYTVLYVDPKGTLYRSNLYEKDTFFVSSKAPREVIPIPESHRKEITALVNQLVARGKEDASLVRQIDALGGLLIHESIPKKNIFDVQAWDAHKKPIKVKL